MGTNTYKVLNIKFHNTSIHSNIKAIEVIKRGLLSIYLVYYALVRQRQRTRAPFKTKEKSM